MSRAPSPGASAQLPTLWRLLHWAILVLFAYQVLYATNQVFFVLAPEGHFGPLNAAATEVDPQLLVARRLYAIEGWIAAIGMSTYVALTEILPRLLQPMLASRS